MDIRCKNRVLVSFILLLWGVAVFAATPRVVSIAPNISELLYYLDLDENLVGVCKESDYPVAVENKAVVGSYFAPDLESIIKLKPDYVITSAEPPQPIYFRLKELGISVKNYHVSNLDDLQKAMLELLALCNVDSSAEYDAFVSKMNQKRISNQEQRAVLLYWLEPPMTTGNKSYLNEVMQRAGLKNIYDDLDRAYVNTDIETIIRKSPEVIVLSGMESKITLPEALAEYVRLFNVKVVYVDKPNLILRPGPRIFEGIKYLEAKLHEK